MKPIITVLEAIHSAGIERLSKFADVRVALGADRNEILKLVSRSDCIIIKSVIQVDKELLDHAEKLQIVGRAGTGIDNIDIEESSKKNIKILTVPEGNSVTAAEFTILKILMLCRRVPEVMQYVSNKDFRRHNLEGRELKKMVIGLVGLGNVGMGVAERLQPFGCKLFGWDPSPANKERFISLGGHYVDSFDEMLPKIDILSFHARLTPESYQMMDEFQFSIIKDGLYLINCARANLINNKALLVAIDAGKVKAAALDVLDPEPPFDLRPNEHSYDHNLLNHPKIIVTPHIGASTVDAQKRIALDLADQIKKSF